MPGEAIPHLPHMGKYPKVGQVATAKRSRSLALLLGQGSGGGKRARGGKAGRWRPRGQSQYMPYRRGTGQAAGGKV